MIFRQLFDRESSTYTYLLAGRKGGEALLIDPVLEHAQQYVRLIEQLELRLVLAVDTHIHADHVTALGALREHTACATAMGEMTRAECVTERFREGERLAVDGLSLEVLYTPGHTDDSYSFLMPDRVFTGDTLLIRGTGRTDFQNGDPEQLYRSLTEVLFALPEQTRIWPGHDYRGHTMTTVGEEKRHNPRVAGKSRAEFVEIMDNLGLPRPKRLDEAVPANRECGCPETEVHA